MICTDLSIALAPILARYDKDQVVVVYDENISLPTGVAGLTSHSIYGLTVSETSKSLETVSLIWDFLFTHGITRRGLLIAVGGGVLTDLCGFAAATYKRGIDYVNIPTTLLSMVDASTGGKTGINYHGLKNSIGLFAPPVATLIWPSWLKTLPPKQFLSGFAEMLKTGLIADQRPTTNDQRLFDRLLQYDLNTMDSDALTPLIADCIAVKEKIVTADPHEEGIRKTLNFGHTFGHALEELSHAQGSPLDHGYAVLYGLIAELYLSVVKLSCPKEPLQQLTQVMLHDYGKPQCKCSDRDKLIALMQQDKKNEHATDINCTLLREVGEPLINQLITPQDAAEALDYLFSL